MDIKKFFSSWMQNYYTAETPDHGKIATVDQVDEGSLFLLNTDIPCQAVMLKKDLFTAVFAPVSPLNEPACSGEVKVKENMIVRNWDARYCVLDDLGEKITLFGKLPDESLDMLRYHTGYLFCGGEMPGNCRTGYAENMMPEEFRNLLNDYKKEISSDIPADKYPTLAEIAGNKEEFDTFLADWQFVKTAKISFTPLSDTIMELWFGENEYLAAAEENPEENLKVADKALQLTRDDNSLIFVMSRRSSNGIILEFASAKNWETVLNVNINGKHYSFGTGQRFASVETGNADISSIAVEGISSQKVIDISDIEL